MSIVWDDEQNNGPSIKWDDEPKAPGFGEIVLKTATDPLLAPFGMDSRTRQAQEVYGRGREGILQSSPFQAMRSGASKEPFKGLVSVADRISPKAGDIARRITPNEIVKQGQGIGVDVGLGLGTDALMSKAPAIAGRMARSFGNAAEEAGGRFLNFYIKPRAAGYKFGANPGRAVAKHIGPQMSREGLFDAIVSKKSDLLNQLQSSVKNSSGEVDATPVFRSIYDTIEYMNRLPKTYADQISSHGALMEDLANMIRSKAKLRDGRVYIDPETAISLKRAIGEIPSWTAHDPKLGSLSKTTRKAYGQFDREIDKVVPGSAELNRDVSDLIGAEKGIELGMQREQNKSPISLLDLGIGGVFGMHGGVGSAFPAIAASKFARSAPFNTTAGAVAGGVGKASRSVAPILESLEKPTLIEQIFQSMKRPKTKALTISR